MNVTSGHFNTLSVHGNMSTGIIGMWEHVHR